MDSTNTFAPGSSARKSRAPRSLAPNSHITVVGAGAFGGWSALYLLRSGYKVTLVDAWGPGNSRSSSGDETRVIRSTYGANEFYFDLNVRARQLWIENEEHFQKQLFFNTGVLWLCHSEHVPLVSDSIPFARRHKMDYVHLTHRKLRERYPFINCDDLHEAYLDPFGGYLKAREACQSVASAFQREGGELIIDSVSLGDIHSKKLKSVRLHSGRDIESDAFLFACGSWLRSLFPDNLAPILTCTRQEVYYFGTPAKAAEQFNNAPVWVDVDGKDFYYGIPGNAYRGFKLGVDIPGPSFDQTSDDRFPDPSVLKAARNFLAHRFPMLANAPVVESRVCPYESTSDGNFIFDTLPNAHNCWIVGGGSGHGFKHGPALGELVANVLSGKANIPAMLRELPRRGTGY